MSELIGRCSWECSRCHKVNATWLDNCDCQCSEKVKIDYGKDYGVTEYCCDLERGHKGQHRHFGLDAVNRGALIEISWGENEACLTFAS